MNAQGSIDACADGLVQGWAAGSNAPDSSPIDVAIAVDGSLVARVAADQYRADLAAAGIGRGHHGFVFQLPTSLRDGREHVLAITAGGHPLHGSPQSFRWLPEVTAQSFDQEGTWIDRPDGAARLARAAPPGLEREWEPLRQLGEGGFALLPALVPHRLLDALNDDLERAWREHPSLLINAHEIGVTPIDQVGTRAAVPDGRYRVMDFHNLSEAALEVATLEPIVSLMRAIFEEAPLVMQSLFFENGSQQRPHQDFAYVHTARPAYLAAAWVACEDVHPDAGPLFYYRRSHRLVPKYDFGNGTILARGNGPHVRAFEDYLAEECERLALEKVEYLPKKGDVLIWHSALVHGGTVRRNRNLTRRSLVTHYSTRTWVPRDVRHPDQDPMASQRNGAFYYRWQAPGHVENAYPLERR